MAAKQPKVFVSHPQEDRVLAGKVVDLLTHGCGLGANDVFCSSASGVGIPAGMPFQEYMRKRLTGATLLVQLITPAYLDSTFCMFELGGAWAKGIPTYPLIVPPVGYDQLDALTGNRQAKPIHDGKHLDELFAEVTKTRAGADMDAWRKARRTFLAFWTKNAAKVSERRTISAAEHDSLTERLRIAEASAGRADVHGHLARFGSKIRDAYLFLPDPTDATFRDQPFLTAVHDAVEALAAFWSVAAQNSCRVGIKWLQAPEEPQQTIPDDEWEVRDLVRSGRSRSKSTTFDSVGGNSDFQQILNGDGTPFFANDLRSLAEAGDYTNSHWTDEMVRNDRVSYRSTIVAPIARFVQGLTGETPSIIGFLCLDCEQANAFDPVVDVNLLTLAADCLYPILHLYAGLIKEKD